jgi:uncharacterized membrane protein YdbT with pleckstrin-like domain
MNEQQYISLKPTIVYALLRSLGQFLIMGVIITVSLYFEVLIGLLVLIIPSMIILFRILYWNLVSYEISPEQIKYTRGILQRRIDFLEMYRIKDFDQRQSLIMNMLGMMHIRLMTSDISHPMLEMKGIPTSNIADVLRALVEQSRKENRVYAID